jgi:hypothetical protein
MKTPQFVLAAKMLMLSSAVFLFSQCSKEEDFVAPDLSAADDFVSAASLTVSGSNAVFAQEEECTTCTFIVPANTTLVDGEALNVKPGDKICLNKAFKYGDLEFINIHGKEDNPVVIAYFSPRMKSDAIEYSVSDYQ